MAFVKGPVEVVSVSRAFGHLDMCETWWIYLFICRADRHKQIRGERLVRMMWRRSRTAVVEFGLFPVMLPGSIGVRGVGAPPHCAAQDGKVKYYSSYYKNSC